MLELREVSRRFGGVQALDGISFAVQSGEILGLIGANGAGKTTLFSVIAGNIRLSGGEVLWHGKSLAGLRPDQIARRGIARTFQVVRPFAGLTVLENAAIAALFGARQSRSPEQAEAHARDALDAVGLADRADNLAGELTLSGQKRLEIARVVASGATLLMLDEVMAGLTPPEVAGMLETLRLLRQSRGLTLVVIEHVMQAVMQLSDRIIVLHLGRVIAQGAPSEIAADEAVSRVYFGKSG